MEIETKDETKRVDDSMGDDRCDKTKRECKFTFKHKNEKFEFVLNVEESTMMDLKEEIKGLTRVEPRRQKIIGLSKKCLKDDKMLLSRLKLKKVNKFVMIGNAEDEILKDRDQIEDLPEVINDLDWDFDLNVDESRVLHLNECLKEMSTRVQSVEVHMINEPRKDKKLLVLDIDYTIFDCKNKNGHIETIKRPYLDVFLETVYKYYDIAFWSQTSWKWIEMKLTEMGILTSTKYKVVFVLDRTSMFKVNSMYRGKKRQHEVKPLEFIFTKFSKHFNAKNTVHIDDLSRNFALNPKNGIKVSQYKDSEVSKHKDTELKWLKRYLVKIVSKENDVRQLDFIKWKKSIKELVKSTSSSSSSSTSIPSNSS